MSIPNASKYVIIGAGIHGLSTAYHLALELKKKVSSAISPYHARAQPDRSFCFVYVDHRGIYWN